MSLTPDEIAVELLIWRARRRADLQRFPNNREFVRRFAEHCAAIYRLRHLEDIQHAVEAFAVSHTCLMDWYAATIQPFEAALTFEDGAPGLAVHTLGQWRKLSARLDPDALLTLRLAQDVPSGAKAIDILAALSNWRFYAPMIDHGLQQVCAPGLADTHIHIEASDPMPLLWLRLATGRVRVEELQLFSDSTLDRMVDDAPGRDRRLAERGWLADAQPTRERLCRHLSLPVPPVDGPPSPHALLEERELLLTAWQRLRQGPPTDTLAGDFDRYLFAKNLFLRRHQQSANQGPGLTRFRDFLDRGETIGEKRRKKIKAAVRRERFGRMLSLATEASCLRILELRIAPQKTLSGWRTLFKLWANLVSQQHAFLNGFPGHNIRFVVHFIRQSDPAATDSCQIQFGKLRQILDRQTAILHLFRHLHPELGQYIIGVDVANLERGCPPELFAPYLRLMRGDRSLSGDFNHPALKIWKRLEDRDLHRPPIGLQGLGITYHAGEDFHHPVDGMRAMSGLARNVLRPGDRIGHGLAVGLDVERFQTERGFVNLPQGVLLDDLVWLRREAALLSEWSGPSALKVDLAIGELSQLIYGSEISRGVLEKALDARFALPRLDADNTEAEAKLIWREAGDKSVQEARARIARPPQTSTLYSAVSIVKAVQGSTIRFLRDRGLAVEANPSSNLITGAVKDLKDHPFFRYLEELDHQTIVSINTDDPGVFGTRIDIEYGLMFEALLANGYDRFAALDILHKSRRTGMDYAFDRHAVGRPGQTTSGIQRRPVDFD